MLAWKIRIQGNMQSKIQGHFCPSILKVQFSTKLKERQQLFSYMQQILDETGETGKFIITGSNNFLLQESISQSLAGRIAYLYLLPFSIDELTGYRNQLDFAGYDF